MQCFFSRKTTNINKYEKSSNIKIKQKVHFSSKLESIFCIIRHIIFYIVKNVYNRYF